VCRGVQSVTPVPAPRADECWRCGQRMTYSAGTTRLNFCTNVSCSEWRHPVAVLSKRPAAGGADV
jgi:hypothetical protein